MPQPTIQDVHVNVPLTDMSLLTTQEDREFVADRMFPILPVRQRSDVYYRYNKGDFASNMLKLRAPGAESAGSGYRLTNTDTYRADVWSLHKDIPDQIRANSDMVLNPDLEATVYLSTQARLNREIQWAAKFFATGIWGNEWSGISSGSITPWNGTGGAAGVTVLKWTNPASTPIQDVRNMKRAIQVTGLKRANKLCLGRPVFDALCDHPDFIDRVKYGQTAPQPAQVTMRIMATLFEVDEVLVMDGIQNTAADGAANPTFSFVGGNNALLAYTPSSVGLMTPVCGVTFAWTGFLGSTAMGSRIKSFYMPWLESTRVEIDNAFTQVVTGSDLGGFFLNAV